MRSIEGPKDSDPVEIKPEHLSEEALHGVIESFVLREGTDYGAVEVSLGTKCRQVLQQIRRGEIMIVFDPESDSVSLMSARDFSALGNRTKSSKNGL